MLIQTIPESRMVNQSGSLGASYVCCFWGNQQNLDKFLQRHAVEKASLEARRSGHSVTESQLADGSIKLTVSVGGAA